MSYTVTAKSTKTVNVYHLNDGFYVEVSEDAAHESYLEFYLCHADTGIKEYMFGLPASASLDPVEIINGNADKYIEDLKNQYMIE